MYTGIAVRVKNVVPTAMEHLLYAFDLDSKGAIGEEKKDDADKKAASKEEPKDAQVKGYVLSTLQQPVKEEQKLSLVNLRFEECRITRKAANTLAEFLKKKNILETLGMVKVTFEDVFDFKKILEGVQQNTKLTKILFSNMVFDEELFGKSIARALIDSRSLKEIDLS